MVDHTDDMDDEDAVEESLEEFVNGYALMMQATVNALKRKGLLTDEEIEAEIDQLIDEDEGEEGE